MTNANANENQISARLEDYLEAFYSVILEKNGVKAVDIAKKLKVQRSSVTEALKVLSAKGLVNYSRYDVISLTQEGESVAKSIIHKHKKLFYFFNEVLGIESDEANETACKIEHVISNHVLERLLEYIEKK